MKHINVLTSDLKTLAEKILKVQYIYHMLGASNCSPSLVKYSFKTL